MIKVKSLVIDRFRVRGQFNNIETFQLTRDASGRYSIKRGKTTLFIYPEEEKARNGFNYLRERRQA